MKKKICILGSTGSIGKTTLQILSQNKKDFKVVLLSGNTNVNLLISQAKKFKPIYIYYNNSYFKNKIQNFCKKNKIKVIESYPGAAQDIMQIPRKHAGLPYLKDGLQEFGMKGDWYKNKVSHDELDAITSAIVGLFYLGGKYEALGNDDEEYLVIPKI